jgi:hypothetical protein
MRRAPEALAEPLGRHQSGKRCRRKRLIYLNVCNFSRLDAGFVVPLPYSAVTWREPLVGFGVSAEFRWQVDKKTAKFVRRPAAPGSRAATG